MHLQCKEFSKCLLKEKSFTISSWVNSYGYDFGVPNWVPLIYLALILVLLILILLVVVLLILVIILLILISVLVIHFVTSKNYFADDPLE